MPVNAVPNSYLNAGCISYLMAADLVGFTSMSKEVPPEEVITFLNALFGHFDRLVEKHRVQKVRGYYCSGPFARACSLPHDHLLRAGLL